jgi:DNA-binding transcriptional LysR family regulator
MTSMSDTPCFCAEIAQRAPRRAARKSGKGFAEMEDLSLDAILLFTAVATAGSLSSAAALTRTSPATLSRQINRLEEITGCALFLRTPTGYQLTEDGRNLLERCQPLLAIREDLRSWRDTAQSPRVRISAGTWTALFLSRNLARIWRPGDAFRIVFQTTEARLGIAHRQIEIGLRNGRPMEANLAGRKLVNVVYAPYRSRDLEERAVPGWVAVHPDHAVTRSARWVLEHHAADCVIFASTPRTLLDLVHMKAGRAVLPCFIGDADTGLERDGPAINDLGEEQWLVLHDETRHRREIRIIADRIVDLVTASSADYAGQS